MYTYQLHKFTPKVPLNPYVVPNTVITWLANSLSTILMHIYMYISLFIHIYIFKFLLSYYNFHYNFELSIIIWDSLVILISSTLYISYISVQYILNYKFSLYIWDLMIYTLYSICWKIISSQINNYISFYVI